MALASVKKKGAKGAEDAERDGKVALSIVGDCRYNIGDFTHQIVE